MIDFPKKHKFEIWAQLFLCEKDCLRIREFFITKFNIKSRYVVRKMHVTVYHSRRAMPGVFPVIEPASVKLAANDTRFMVMAPGGENPSPDLAPMNHMVGFRIQKKSLGLPSFFSYRERLINHETKSVLGSRNPSTFKTNAFGARYYQPHMVVLEAKSGIGHDLSNVGIPFRESLGDLFLIGLLLKLLNALVKHKANNLTINGPGPFIAFEFLNIK